MESVRSRRLTNELGSLRHVHGILVEFDTDENLMRVRMQKKKYLIRIPATYPFEPPSITDQKGSVIRIDEKTMYSITDILTGLRLEKIGFPMCFSMKMILMFLRLKQEREKKL